MPNNLDKPTLHPSSQKIAHAPQRGRSPEAPPPAHQVQMRFEDLEMTAHAVNSCE